MKAKHFLIPALLLLFSLLALTACKGNPPMDTTAADTTATTTAPTTTVTTTITVSQNPITEVTSVKGLFQLTYADTTKQSLGAADVREGYNSVICTSAPLQDGVLTLTLRDSAALNIANDFLQTAPADLVVRLRERDGNLEWAAATGDNWQVLCPYKVTSGKSILTRLCEATEFGKVTMPEEESMVFVISDNTLRFRAKNWVQPGFDFCTNIELHSAATNNNMMFQRFDVIPSSTVEGSVAVSNDTLFKSAVDEIPSISVNGGYISARHGYYLISAIPNTAGLTETDIGTVFTRSSDEQQYVLVKVPNGELWFCPFDDDAMESGVFQKYIYGSKGLLASGDTLTTTRNLSSGGRTLNVTTNATLKQFYIATNHAVQRAYLNGTVEVDLEANGIYHAEFIDFYEEYDVIYLPAVLDYLKDNVGFNDNDSHHDAKINEAYLTYIHTHRFHKNGSYTVYQTVAIKKPLRNVHYYGVMSLPFSGDRHYVYAPGSTNVGTPTLQTNTTMEAEGDWRIRSYYQLTDTVGTKGLNVGYYPYFGLATDEDRQAALGNKAGIAAGQWFETRKMYPYLFMNQNMATGDEISFIAYHVPTAKLDDEFFAVSWYFVGDEIYLSLHTDKAVERKLVALPNSDYLAGLSVTVDEASAGFTVHSTTVTLDGIEVSTTGAGYVTVKLTR